MPNILVGNFSYLMSADATPTGVPVTSYILDNRRSTNYATMVYATTTPSAAIGIDLSVDGTGWIRAFTVTGTPTTATAQVSGFMPYVRAVMHTAFGNAGATGSASVFWAAGVKSVLG